VALTGLDGWPINGQKRSADVSMKIRLEQAQYIFLSIYQKKIAWD